MITDAGFVKVRWYDEKYAGQLAALYADCYPDENWSAADFHAFVYARGKTNVLKVLVDERDVVYGAIMYTLTEYECNLRRVAVAAGHRRGGLATHMVNQLVGARSPICKEVFSAAAYEDNAAGLALLEGMKFGNRERRTNAAGRSYWFLTRKKTRPQRTLAAIGHNTASKK